MISVVTLLHLSKILSTRTPLQHLVPVMLSIFTHSSHDMYIYICCPLKAVMCDVSSISGFQYVCTDCHCRSLALGLFIYIVFVFRSASYKNVCNLIWNKSILGRTELLYMSKRKLSHTYSSRVRINYIQIFITEMH